MALDRAYIAEREEALYQLAKLAEGRGELAEFVADLAVEDRSLLSGATVRFRDGRMNDRLARIRQRGYRAA